LGFSSQTECPSLLPLGPRAVYNPRRYVSPFSAITTFEFGCGHNVKSVYACFKTGVPCCHTSIDEKS
jgi:hypothetical protein